MSAQPPSIDLDHALHVDHQHGDTNSSRTSHPQSDHSSSESLLEAPLHHYQSGQQITLPTIGRHVTEENTILGERQSLEIQHVHRQDGQCATMPAPLVPSSPSQSEYSVGKYSISEAERGLAEKQHSLSKTAIALISVAVLQLILVPGVVLGVLIKEVEMGIALSSAIATVIGIFAGFYHYCFRKG